MTSEITPTESEFNKLGHEVYEHDPETVKKFLYVLNRPVPTFTHTQFIWPLQQKFCELNKIPFYEFRGKKPPSKSLIPYRRDFIAAIIYLFNPEILTGYNDVVVTGLAEEITKAIKVDRSWVSQEIKKIKNLFKENKHAGQFVIDQRKTVQMIAEHISDGLLEIHTEETGEVVSLFKDQTG